ncbi:MAG: aminoacyl-tRNA hydrolase [Candidatus Binataceae bacterium]
MRTRPPMSRLGNLFGGFRAKKTAESRPDGETRSALEWVIAGLGNPGEQYHRARHNLGFMMIDRIAGNRGVELSRRRFKALCAETKIAGRAAMLVKPQTYYNLSGESVAAILGYFKVPVERLIVLHYDLDLQTGGLRLKRGGGDAGNRGVRSIAEVLDTPDFVRVRIGIGRPPGESDSKDYVLKPMTTAEIHAFDAIFDRITEAVEAVITSGLERAMSQFNQRV